MMRKASLLVSAALLWVTGCNADEDTTGISTARTEMAPLVNAACDWMFGCCSTGELAYQFGAFTVDDEDCSGRLLDAISAGVPLEFEQAGLSNDPAEGLLILALSINEGRVDVNRSAVQDCAEATRTRDCNVPAVIADPAGGRCTPNANQADSDPCDPNEMFTGKQQVGQQCDGPWECAEGLRCADFGIAGVCAVLAREGETCFSDGECGSGLICSYDTGECVEGALAGEGCMFADPLNPIPGTETVRCADGLACDPNQQICAGGFCAPGSPCEDMENDTDCPLSFYCAGNSFTSPTCQAPAGLAAPCSKPADCETGYCDPFSELCGELLEAGNECGSDGECQSGFCFNNLCTPSYGPGGMCASGDNRECQGGYCDITTDPANPTCAAYLPEGLPCPTSVECDPSMGLQCVDALCLSLPFPNGTTCVDNSQCASQACFMGQCATGAVIGAPCRADGSTEPCILGSFCETVEGAIDGTCAALRGSGEACESADQCWGECIVRYGQRVCDATPEADKVWCDGPS